MLAIREQTFVHQRNNIPEQCSSLTLTIGEQHHVHCHKQSSAIVLLMVLVLVNARAISTDVLWAVVSMYTSHLSYQRTATKSPEVANL